MKVDFSKLERAFNPRVVVVVGDSKATNFEWIRGQKNFKGKLYSVHVNPATFDDIKALGVQNFTRLQDIPEPVDLAIVAVSRKAAVDVLDDLIEKDVAAAHFFSAGFSETNTEEGLMLERQLVAKAEAANFHLIGPNCMGIFNPAAGIKQSEDQYTGTPGPVGFLSQSGSVAITFSLDAHLQGLDVNKAVSYGNGVVVDSPDFIEFFGRDSGIRAIGMYLEGVKNGPRFLSVLKDVAGRKPVVIWKGGRTEEGGRAIASHTGSLALPKAVWDGAVRQCGALQVVTMEELIDTLKALLFLPDVRGNRVAIAGGAGGQSVATTDEFAEVGLRVPLLTRESYDELASFFEVVGGSYRNPIDVAGPVRRDMRRVMGILAQDTNIDNLVFLAGTKPGRHILPEQFQNTIDLLEHFRQKTDKPVVAIVSLHNEDAERETREIMLKLQSIGIPAFPSIQRGALALRNALNYYDRRRFAGNN